MIWDARLAMIYKNMIDGTTFSKESNQKIDDNLVEESNQKFEKKS